MMDSSEELSVSPMRMAMNVGAVVAALMLLASLVGWHRISWIVFIIGIRSGMKRHRREIGGTIGYFKKLQAGFQTAFFAGLILAFFAYASATFDPLVIDAAIDAAEQRMIASGASTMIVEPAIEQMREMMTPVIFASIYIFMYCAIGGLASIVLAFLVRKHIVFVEFQDENIHNNANIQ